MRRASGMVTQTRQTTVKFDKKDADTQPRKRSSVSLTKRIHVTGEQSFGSSGRSKGLFASNTFKRSVYLATGKNTDDDEFLETIKAKMNDEHQSLLGIQVGRKKQAMIVKLSDDRTLAKQLQRSMSGAGKSRPHDLQLPEYTSSCMCALPLIHPYSKRLMMWQTLLVVMIAYNMVFVPYELAYGVCASSEATDTLDNLSDGVFILDVVVQLHVMLTIHEKHTDRTLIVDDRRIIAKEYLRYQFWMDVLSIGAPFGSDKHLTSESNTSSYKKYFRLGALKILKLLRIAKAFKIIASVFTVSASVVQRFNVAKLLLFIVYSSHLIGCTFSGIARTSGSPNWVEASVNPNASQVWESCKTNPAPPTEEYISALYWAVMTLTTVGYGEWPSLPSGHFLS
jgi:hypothetical protein